MAIVTFNTRSEMNAVKTQAFGGGSSSATSMQYSEGIAGNAIGYIGDLSENGHIDKVFLSASLGPIPEIEITGLSIGMTNDLRVQFEFGFLQAQLTILLSGNDVLTGSTEDDAILGYGGNDTLIGGSGGDFLDGGTGINTASYSKAKAGLFAGLEDANSNTGDAAGDDYTTIQNLIGSKYSDILYGTGEDNRFTGGSGNDLMIGKGGADTFNGGAGSDTVGYDADFAGVIADLVNPYRNTSTATGDIYVSIENLEGSSNNDRLYGDNKANVIGGNVYHDSPSGDDKLYGRDGNDKLNGYDGNDTLVGGSGVDKLYGGSGADTFVFSTGDSGKTISAADTIYDFTSADHIDLSSWDANSSKIGTQNFDFIGMHAFSGHAGQLRYEKSASDTWIEGDTNGDKKADFYIHLDDAFSLAAGYFAL